MDLPPVSNDPPLVPVPRPRWLLMVMMVWSVGLAGLFAFSLLAALMSPMIFDSGETPKLWAAFFAFLAFPVFLILSGVISWCGFGFRRYALIPIGMAMPVIYLVIFWFSSP